MTPDPAMQNCRWWFVLNLSVQELNKNIIEGDRMRITAAQNVVANFGISSECGWGRTNSERVPGLMSSHRLAAQNLSKNI